MPLQTVYRPSTLEEFAGNEALKESLASVLSREGDIPHTFFFSGPSGCGKTTLARITAKIIGCGEWDLHYYNAANTRGIDTVRDVISTASLHPVSGKVKVFLFDECHQLTGPAQEAFLKETEEPAPHVFFIFCTTEPDQMKPTFKRRGFNGAVKPLTRSEIMALLESVIADEGIEEYPREILQKISMSCNGSAGIALNLLDSVIDIEDNDVALKAIEEVTVSEVGVKDLCQTLLDPRLSAENKWAKVKGILKVLPGEPESLRRAILGYMNVVLLSEKNPDKIVDILSLFLDSYFVSGRVGLNLSCYLACKV